MAHSSSFTSDMKWICWLFLDVPKAVLRRRSRSWHEWGWQFSFLACICAILYKFIGVLKLCYIPPIFHRYAYPWWKEKVINSDLKRKDGLCPLTPEETALILTALDIDRSIQIYIAAGEIYGAERRMASLSSAFPNVVSSLQCMTLSNTLHIHLWNLKLIVIVVV